MPMMVGKGRRFFEWQAVTLFVICIAAAAWLLAPFAILKAFGELWVLPWLIPTGAAVCSMGLARANAGTGG